MDTTGVIQLLILLILLILSGFFSSAETALTCANKVRIRSLADEGNKRALRVQIILESYSKVLSTILIGNNIVNIGASSLATTLTIRLFGNRFVGICTGILTFLVLIFGEIVPKTWAGSHADKIALAYSGIIHILMTVLTPIIWIVDNIAQGIIRLFHLGAKPGEGNITQEELRTYVDVSHEEGVIESGERKFIHNVFDFSDSTAAEIMIPRINMTTLSSDSTYEEIFTQFKKTMYTRIPVYEDDNPDNVIGFVHMKDFILTKDSPRFKVNKILRNVYYTYERKKTSDLFVELREKATNIAIVLDEYGSAVGMITMEDLLEEIVGEIRDEYDADEAELIKKIDTHRYLIEGSMKVDDVNEALNLSLESEDYDSIGGIMIDRLDRLPKNNETVVLENGISLQARGISQNRIRNVLIKFPQVPDDEKDTDG
ncbi:HlyC/CorC family transporter [bacterium 1XD8-76]|nr:HlyC/CorC family transporter [bacterium 1XD8-76]